MLVLERIKRVKLERFRGFTNTSDSPWIDTDADIVLLLGANGKGKSSLLEALQLVLTGAPVPRPHEGANPHALLAVVKAPGVPQRHETFEIVAEVDARDDANGARRTPRVTVSGQREASGVRITFAPQSNESYPPAPFPERREEPQAADSQTASPPSQEPRLLIRTYLSSEAPEGMQLQSRLTSFFQHDVGRIFDDAARGRTVLDLAEPVPVRIRHLVSALQRAVASIEKWQSNNSGDAPTVHETDGGKLDDYRGKLVKLVEGLPSTDPVLVAIPNASDATALADAVAQIMRQSDARTAAPRDVPSRLRHWLDQKERTWLESLKDEARRTATRDELASARQELVAVNAHIEAIRKARPRIEEEAIAFRGAVRDAGASSREGPDRLPGLGLVLEALHRGLEAWKQDSLLGFGPRPAELHRELQAIRQDALGAFASELREWTDKLEKDGRDQRAWQKRRAELERQIGEQVSETDRVKIFRELFADARLVPEEEWSRLIARETWEAAGQARQRRSEIAQELKLELERSVRDVETAREYNPAILKQIRGALDEILSRFCIADKPAVDAGAVEQDIDLPSANGEQRTSYTSARMSPKFGDGRELADLSSGQHAQMAVACVVGQNLLVAQAQPPIHLGMPHRVLLLDDVSSTYDLTNLLREAILWRQLAYTDNLAVKRQIFLASHHEDLTNQLLDHLVPPAGHSMRVLQFEDWSLEEGPTIGPYAVQPTSAHDNPQACKAFRERIEVLFDGA